MKKAFVFETLAAQSTYFKTTISKSKDTGIFFENAAVDFMGKTTDIMFVLYKEDYVMALSNLLFSLPLYSSPAGVPTLNDDVCALFSEYSTMINTFFGEGTEALYGPFTLSETTGGRFYLYKLDAKGGFNIRKFLVAGRSQITLIKREDDRFDLRLQTLANNPLKESFEQDFLLDITTSSTPSLPPLDPSQYTNIITAAKTKPFILLAGISGTGKSRIVRELARACWDEGSDAYKAQKPQNFEMIQVKPNWHDSTELLGYVSRVSGKPVYVVGDFLRFVAKAWGNIEVPHFLCLDEMNLAPVEQYFAEYLSVVESRKLRDGKVVTDAILKQCSEQWFFDLTAQLTDDEELRNQFNNEGIALPPNLIVVGTVNMDETTFSFSRKVLDRAMTIEMNEVNLRENLKERQSRIGLLGRVDLIGETVEGADVYDKHPDVYNIVIDYLEQVNEQLNKTPFKVAYRTGNEFLLYVMNNLRYNKDEQGNSISQAMVIARALDKITSMKVLSRIEGDDTKVPKTLLTGLKHCIEAQLLKITGEDDKIESVSIKKLDEMQKRLESGYTSFWS